MYRLSAQFSVCLLTLIPSLVACSRTTIDFDGDPDQASGGAGVSGLCAPSDLVCDGYCTNVSLDTAHCGNCETQCAPDEFCIQGSCEPPCPGDSVRCGDTCVRTEVDSENCGACGFLCPGGALCEAGKCRDECSASLAQCGASCIDLEFDPEHCGMCDVPCGEGSYCSEGQCDSTCLGESLLCEGACVDAENSPNHCGTCGNACANGEICSQGICSISCLGGTTRCEDRCVDLTLDATHCGDCDVTCGADEVCVNSQCSSVCGEGLKKCGNECIDLSDDKSNCGGCGNACSSGENCIEGECVSCNSAVEDCDADGWLASEGDCCDKPSLCGFDPSLVNPGAIEVLGNGVDDNCNGAADLFDAAAFSSCDGSLPSAPSDLLDMAKAFGICAVTTENPGSPSEKTHGLISVELRRADGAALTASGARSIRTSFGGISVTEGSSLVVLSSGVAADTSQTNPGPSSGAPSSGNVSSAHSPASVANLTTCTHSSCVSDWLESANPPLKGAGDLPQAPECGAQADGTFAVDSVMLVLRLRAPTNARAFSFNSYFLSAEFPEYVCSAFNDQFVALVDTPTGTPSPIPNPVDKNLLTYHASGQKWPIGINIAKGTSLFSVCAPQTGNVCWDTDVSPASCSLGPSALLGTGFEAPSTAPSNTCTIGGGTGWLTTAGNVLPGEIVELRIALWDVGDANYDSTALIDGFEWLTSATLPGTN